MRWGNVFALLCACMAVAVPSAVASSPQAPQQLVSRLAADQKLADRHLRIVRSQLGAVVVAQRAAEAKAGRATANEALVRGIAKLADMKPSKRQRRAFDVSGQQLQRELARLDQQLEDATDEAAQAQGFAQDAERRLRALQRAATTADTRDTTLGSWRFGSGGPAVSAASLDQYLVSKGSPMAGQGAALLEAGVEHEVDPRLVVAIAGAESYFGVVTCAPYNGWGWGCPDGPYRFESWASAIDTVTAGLRTGYIDSGRTSVGSIHLRYAPPAASNDPDGLNYGWADNVAGFMIEQGADPENVAGVLGPSR